MEESLFEAVGGSTAVLALARAWHQRCLDDPLASHPFSHGDLHPRHVERLAAYWGEAIGGPADYTRTMGTHADVMEMHGCNGPHPELDARTIELFGLALEDADIPERARPALERYFAEMTERMAAYEEGADVASEELPHWSWHGPVEPPSRSSVDAMTTPDPTIDVPETCPHCGTEMQTATIDFDPSNEPRAELNPGEMAQVAFCPNPDCPGKALQDD